MTPVSFKRLRPLKDAEQDRQAFCIEYTHEDGTVENVKVVRWESFHRWRKRTGLRLGIAFVGLTIASVTAGLLANNASDNLAVQARTEVARSCADRAELRIAVAVGFDELRRTAIADQGAAAQTAFLLRTQPPVDRLLSEAAGATIRAEVTPRGIRGADLKEVRDLAETRCNRRAILVIQDPE